MKISKSISLFSMLMAVVLMVSSCGSSSSATKEKKPKGIILAEGDPAVLTDDGQFTTITFPEVLSAQDLQFYQQDLVGYLLASNAKVDSDGGQMGAFRIYYYLHDNKSWLYKGEYEEVQRLPIKNIKKLKIANSAKYLREFNTLMPLLDQSREKKNDSGYQEELRSGSSRYIFMEVELR